MCPYCAKGSEVYYDSCGVPVHYVGETVVLCHGGARLNKPEPPPQPNESVPVWELVIADMRARDNFGRNKYGTPLQTHNGRNSLVDLYQELLDAAVYVRLLIEEQKHGA